MTKELADFVNEDTAFYKVIKEVINPKLSTEDIVYMQIVEDKILDNGLEFEEVMSVDEFVRIKIRKTDKFQIYRYIRRLNRVFNLRIRRKSYSSDRWYYYVDIRKEKLLK